MGLEADLEVGIAATIPLLRALLRAPLRAPIVILAHDPDRVLIHGAIRTIIEMLLFAWVFIVVL